VRADITELEGFGSALAQQFATWQEAELFTDPPVHKSPADAGTALTEGHILLTGIPPVAAESSQTILADLHTLLSEHLPEEQTEVAAITDYLREDDNLAVCLDQVLQNQGSQLHQLCDRQGFSANILTYYALYLARPYRAKLAAELTGQQDLSSWNRGYCPVCGHWPSLAHLESEEGKRTLWCLHCDTRWNYKRIQCVYCGNEEQEQLRIFFPEGNPDHQIQACSVCRRYLKQVRNAEPAADFPFDTVYMGTAVLDLLGREENFIQEPLLTMRTPVTTASGQA